jgi:predicted DNA-binding transcriptional regulator YafY
VRAERFERPDGFDLQAYWQASSAAFDRSILRARVTVRLSPHARRMLPHVTSSAAAAEALAAGGPPDREGWCTVDLAVESEAVAQEQLTSLGGGVEVLQPGSLRAALAATGREMAERNRSG